MQKLLTITAILISYSLSTTAQTSWQWGKRGGTPRAGSATTSEGEVEMVTDQKGDLYVLAVLSHGDPALIDTSNGPNANNRLSLTKWGCNGDHKWTRYFGSGTTMIVPGSALAIDSLGGLYFTGVVTSSSYFDSDTLLNPGNKQWFITKYDTAGAFQWLRMPQADSVTLIGVGGTANKTRGFALDVAPDGKVYILSHLAPGIFSGSFVNPGHGFYMMEYDKDGNFINAKPMDITINFDPIDGPMFVNFEDRRTGFARDHNSGRFYLSGWYNSNWGSLTFGTTALESNPGSGKPMYLSAFDSIGNHLWIEQSGSSATTMGIPYSRPRIDEMGNIYISGGSQQGNTFFGHTFSNAYNPLYYALFVMSIDSTGNLRWARNAANGNATEVRGISYAKGIISISDVVMEHISWGANTISMGLTNGFNYVTHFNAHTGTPIKNVDTFGMTGPGSGTTDLIADGNGNFYVGGNMAHQVILPSGTLTNIGGTFDFFVAKYGAADCNCSLATPDLTYTSTSGSTAVSFSYTGSTPVDSVRWEFGDGAMASGLTASHTYATAGTYGVSIVVYNACGIAVHYKEVTTGSGTNVRDKDLVSAVSIYPNPSKESITIEGAGPGTAVELYNTIGQRVLSTTITAGQQLVDVSSLNSGMYIIQFITKEGRKGSVKMMKQ